ncbi:MAG: YceD family protein [Desulfomonilaceae bacterium]
MKIHIEDIPRNGLEIEFDGSNDVLTEALASVTLPPDVSVNPRITGRVEIKRDFDKFLIHGDVEAKMMCKCSRCLCPYEQTISVNVDLVATSSSDQADDYEQESKLEYNEILIENDEIDIGELIVQEIFLDIPMKPLCKDDCPGLCPKCGAVLGADGCECSNGTEIDSRWEKLITLKPRLNN